MRRLVYLCAFMVEPGTAIVDAPLLMEAIRADVVEWPTDHSPFLTHPEQVADLICGAFG